MAPSRSRPARSSSATAGSSRPGTSVQVPAGRDGHRRDAASGSRRASSPVSRASALREVDLAATAPDDTGANGPFSAAIDVAPAINPAGLDDRRQPRRRRDSRRRRSGRGQKHFRRAGRGHRHRRRHGPDHRGAALPVRRARRNGRGHGRRVAGLGPCAVPQRAARSFGTAPLRPADRAARRAPSPTNASARSSAIPTNRGSTAATRGAARTCC